jgi:hypothetical protein
LSSINIPGRKSLINDPGEKQLEKLTDSAESATSKFRDRFEDFLHQDLPSVPTPSLRRQTTTGINKICLHKHFLH